MTKYLIAELAGSRLDYAVAMCQGLNAKIWDGGVGCWAFYPEDRRQAFPFEYNPSELYEQGMEIIENEKIDLEGIWNVKGCGVRTSFKEWKAIHPKNHGGLVRFFQYGDTMLEAGLRAYVSSCMPWDDCQYFNDILDGLK